MEAVYGIVFAWKTINQIVITSAIFLKVYPSDTCQLYYRIENEEEVKADAVFLQKQPDLETVLQRIENFEVP